MCPKKQAASRSNFYAFFIVSYSKKEHNNLGLYYLFPSSLERIFPVVSESVQMKKVVKKV
jgi:hypothetical protein